MKRYFLVTNLENKEKCIINNLIKLNQVFNLNLTADQVKEGKKNKVDKLQIEKIYKL